MLELPTNYKTRLERWRDWSVKHDTEIAFYGAALIAAFLLADYLSGGLWIWAH